MDQLGRNDEAYVDDMIVKSRYAKSHCANLTETFATLRKYQMNLNPEKCAFGVESGKFLGFMVIHRGIKANLEKFQTILDMASLKTPHEIQKLTGRLAALNHFLAKSGDKCHLFSRP